MAKIILPDRIFGRNVDGAMEKVLNGDKSQPDPVPEQTVPQISASNLNGYIWVPSINLHFAKNRDLNGKTWNQAMDIIYNQGINVKGQRAEMPTPFEFMSCINYLSSGKVDGLSELERQDILNDILKLGSYRGNWLNARFVKLGKGFKNLGMEKVVFNSVGKRDIITKPLEQCLWQDGWADINSGNSQGLLTNEYGSGYEQGKNIYFWYPRETGVARFGAGSDGAGLRCDWGADFSNPSLGVRLVVRPKGASAKK